MGMKPRHLLKELERVAESLGLRVRTQAFRGSGLSVGGLCKLKGEPVVLLNLRANEDERALMLAAILRDMDTTLAQLSEEARELLIAPSRQARQYATRPAPSKGPGLRRARPKK